MSLMPLKRLGLLVTAMTTILLLPPVNGGLVALWEISESKPGCDFDPQIIAVLPGGLRSVPAGNPAISRLTDESLRRLAAGAEFAHQYPKAQLLVLGNSAEATAMSTVFESRLFQLPPAVDFDGSSLNTRAAVKRLASLAGDQDVWLITSSLHMRRALSALGPTSTRVCPKPYESMDHSFVMHVLPGPTDVQRSKELLHEVLGYVWYQILDWLGR